ncbi:gamma carbonic anhydrase family protein [Mycetocola zhadangensis]|uniref:gamma carbonic anhydrase family protein n=1 Tax=Mycetocola zhadangensis TaxID=1164595 RepID=UPI003A4D3F4E
MTSYPDSTILRLTGIDGPVIADTAFVAPGARIIGNVTLKPASSVWYNAVLRGDSASIELGEGSNIQDGVAVHVDSSSPVVIGKGVSVGHNAVIHGCTIGDTVLVGMGAVVLSGAVIGDECLIAGGAVVLSGAVIPPRSLVAGVPGKVRRELTDDEIDGIRKNAEIYLEHSRHHAESLDGDSA